MGDPRHDYSPSLGQMADKPLFGVSKWRVSFIFVYEFFFGVFLKKYSIDKAFN